MRTVAWLTIFTALAASSPFSWAGPDGALRIELSEKPLEPGSLKTMLGLSLRQDQREAAPDGFDSVFSLPGCESKLFLKSGEQGVPQIFLSSGNETKKLDECGGAVFGRMKAFGPVRVSEGLPLVTVHAPVQVPQSARARASYVYVMPASALEGEIEIGGRRARLALVDANLDGDCSDPCVQHMRTGDWFAVDLDGDGKLAIDQSGNEGRPLTRRIEIGGRTWSWSFEGRTLTLIPAPVGIIQVRIDGLCSEAGVYGWSELTGFFRTDTRIDGSFEIPDADALIYNYTVSSGDWKATGQLSTKGKISSPGQGGVKTIVAGPPLRPILESRRMPDDKISFSARLVGRAGESFTLTKGGKRAPAAVLVIVGPDGAEAHRATMSYG